MGIRFIDSILSLLTAACGVGAAYFFGHGLSNTHAAWPWITGSAFAVAAVALGFVTIRRVRSFAARPPRTH